MASLFARRNKKPDTPSKLVSGPSALTPRTPHPQNSSSMHTSSPATPLYERFARTGSTVQEPVQHGDEARSRTMTEGVVSATSTPRPQRSNRVSRADDRDLEGGYVNVNLNVAKSPGRSTNAFLPSISPAKSQKSLPRSITEKPLPDPVSGPSSIATAELNSMETTGHHKYPSAPSSSPSLRISSTFADGNDSYTKSRGSSTAYMSSEDEDFEAPERTRGRSRIKTSPLPTIPQFETSMKSTANTLISHPSPPATPANASSEPTIVTSIESPAISTPISTSSSRTSPLTPESSMSTTSFMTTLSEDKPSANLVSGVENIDTGLSSAVNETEGIMSPKMRKKYSPLAAFGLDDSEKHSTYSPGSQPSSSSGANVSIRLPSRPLRPIFSSSSSTTPLVKESDVKAIGNRHGPVQSSDKVARNAGVENPRAEEKREDDGGVVHRTVVVRPSNGFERGRTEKGSTNSVYARALAASTSSPPPHQQPYNQHVALLQRPQQPSPSKRGPLPSPPVSAQPVYPLPASRDSRPLPGPPEASVLPTKRSYHPLRSRQTMESSADERLLAKGTPPHRSQIPTPPLSDDEEEKAAGGARDSVYFDASTGSRNGVAQTMAFTPGTGSKLSSRRPDELGIIPDVEDGRVERTGTNHLLSPVSSPESEHRNEREGFDSKVQINDDHHGSHQPEDFLPPSNPPSASVSHPNKLKSKVLREHPGDGETSSSPGAFAEGDSKAEEKGQPLSSKTSRNKLQKAPRTPPSNSPTAPVFPHLSSTSITSPESSTATAAQGRMPVRAPLQSAVDQWMGYEADPFAKDAPRTIRREETSALGVNPKPKKNSVSPPNDSAVLSTKDSISQEPKPDARGHVGKENMKTAAPTQGPPENKHSPRARRHGEVRGESLAQGSTRPREVLEALAQVEKSGNDGSDDLANRVDEPTSDAMEVVEVVAAEEKEPTFYPLAAHLQDATLLLSLLRFLSFREWCVLTAVNDATRRAIEHKRELRETVLEYWLGASVGYERWRWENKEIVQLTFRDLNAYMRGISIPTHQYAFSSQHWLETRQSSQTQLDSQPQSSSEQSNGLKKRNPTAYAAQVSKSLLASSCRAYTRVVLRLRAQADALALESMSFSGNSGNGVYMNAFTPPQSTGSFVNYNGSAVRLPGSGSRSQSRHASRPASPTGGSMHVRPRSSYSASGHGHDTRRSTSVSRPQGSFDDVDGRPLYTRFHSPLYKPGHAPLLRVFVPSPEGEWLSDASVLECEKELKRAGVLSLLKVGDIVWDAAVGDEGNVGRMVWDGNYLIDLDYTYSMTGELPAYLHTMSFPPAYFHRVIRTPGNPVVHIDISPWGEEIAANLQLLQDRVRTETPQGGHHTVVRWIHRSSFRVRPNPFNKQPIRIPGTALVVDPGWWGTVVVETEGTNEGLLELQDRCKTKAFPQRPAGVDKIAKSGKNSAGAKDIKEPSKIYRLLRERSRPGEIWIRAVREKERLM